MQNQENQKAQRLLKEQSKQKAKIKETMENTAKEEVPENTNPIKTDGELLVNNSEESNTNLDNLKILEPTEEISESDTIQAFSENGSKLLFDKEGRLMSEGDDEQVGTEEVGTDEGVFIEDSMPESELEEANMPSYTVPTDDADLDSFTTEQLKAIYALMVQYALSKAYLGFVDEVLHCYSIPMHGCSLIIFDELKVKLGVEDNEEQ